MPTAAGIYYYEHGGGGKGKNVLVLLHGAGGAREQWPHHLRRLNGWRVLAPDLPGHGRSLGKGANSIEKHARALGEWMAGLELAPAVVVGHSMGGAIALALALERPELLRGLVLISCAAQMPVNPQILDRLVNPANLQPVAHSIAEWSFAKQKNPRLRNQFYQQLLASGSKQLFADFRACSEFDLRKQLGQIRKPALVLSAEQDRMVAPASSRALSKELPNAEFQLLEGAGHMVILEKPRAVQTAISEFLLKL